MSLLSRRSTGSTCQMLRLLTALLICVLVFSHGTMGSAAPHGDAAGHSHVGEHSHDVLPDAGDGDHHSEKVDLETVDLEADATGSGSQPDDSKTADVAHGHTVAGQVPADATLPNPPPGGVQPTGLVVTALASAPQAPLLEPPSA